MKPSVTQLIGLLDKPALMKWANRIGLEGTTLDEYRQKSMAKGTSMHNQIEQHIKNKTPFEDKNLGLGFLNFFTDKKIIECEKKVECDYFNGRLDLIMEFDSRKYLCDFKSKQGHIYFENKLQLSAYRMCEPCDDVCIISIPDFRVLTIDIVDYTPYEEILKSLSNIYKLKQGL